MLYVVFQGCNQYMCHLYFSLFSEFDMIDISICYKRNIHINIYEI